MTDDGAPDLAGLCADVASELDEVSSSPDGDTLTYRRGSVTFAHVSRSTLEVRLPADIGEVALRTPDTTTADAAGWVRFTPSDAERHVTDRATAWFQTAWRHAGDN